MSGALIVANDELVIDARVRTWHETGCEFRAGIHTGVLHRDQTPDTLLWHWTSAENPAEQVYRTLRERRLGVELCVDREGVVYQFCDLALVNARDAGARWDRRSIGVEVVCYGIRRPYTRPWNLLGTPPRARDREVVEARARGRRCYVAAFYPAQLQACFAISDALHEAFGIRTAIPRDAQDRVLDRPFTPKEAAAWQGGELGHLHCTSGAKLDPGTWFFDRLAEHHTDRLRSEVAELLRRAV